MAKVVRGPWRDFGGEEGHEGGPRGHGPSAQRGEQSGSASCEPERAYNPEDISAEQAEKILEELSKTDAANSDKEWPVLKIAGETIEDPKQAYENFKKAFAVVKEYFGKKFNIDLDEIIFKQLPGLRVGEATERAILLDPKMLKHPAIRLAHVIAHELAHNKKLILNEALVEAYVHLWFGKDGTKHTYEAAQAKFMEFARRFDESGDEDRGTEEIYNLYFDGNFEQIYQQYKVNHVNKLQSAQEKKWAIELFSEVFPELHYGGKRPGYYELKMLGPPEDDDGPARPEPDDSIDVRAKVREREVEVKTGTNG